MIGKKVNLNSDFFSNFKKDTKKEREGDMSVVEESAEESKTDLNESSLTFKSVKRVSKIGIDHRTIMQASATAG